MTLNFVNSDSPLRTERGCRVCGINKLCWGEVLLISDMQLKSATQQKLNQSTEVGLKKLIFEFT